MVAGTGQPAAAGRPTYLPAWFSPATSLTPAPVTARAEAHRRAVAGAVAPSPGRRWAWPCLPQAQQRAGDGPRPGSPQNRAVTITRYGQSPESWRAGRGGLPGDGVLPGGPRRVGGRGAESFRITEAFPCYHADNLPCCGNSPPPGREVSR